MKTAFMLSAAIVIPIWLAIFLSGYYQEEEIPQIENKTITIHFKPLFCSSWSQGFLKDQTCKI